MAVNLDSVYNVTMTHYNNVPLQDSIEFKGICMKITETYLEMIDMKNDIRIIPKDSTVTEHPSPPISEADVSKLKVGTMYNIKLIQDFEGNTITYPPCFVAEYLYTLGKYHVFLDPYNNQLKGFIQTQIEEPTPRSDIPADPSTSTKESPKGPPKVTTKESPKVTTKEPPKGPTDIVPTNKPPLRKKSVRPATAQPSEISACTLRLGQIFGGPHHLAVKQPEDILQCILTAKDLVRRTPVVQKNILLNRLETEPEVEITDDLIPPIFDSLQRNTPSASPPIKIYTIQPFYKEATAFIDDKTKLDTLTFPSYLDFPFTYLLSINQQTIKFVQPDKVVPGYYLFVALKRNLPGYVLKPKPVR